ncbi:MAG TPA: hypothetical protein VHO93_10765 [Actinomycetota bacterium]|nr:hypothetical protein [Actinomycetota bacterium]
MVDPHSRPEDVGDGLAHDLLGVGPGPGHRLGQQPGKLLGPGPARRDGGRSRRPARASTTRSTTW